jgi:hypothetical protein
MIQPFRAYVNQALMDYATYLKTQRTKEASLAQGYKLVGAKQFAMFLLGTPPREPFAGRKKADVAG